MTYFGLEFNEIHINVQKTIRISNTDFIINEWNQKTHKIFSSSIFGLRLLQFLST